MNKPEWTPGPWEVDSGMVQTVREHACNLENCGVHIPIAWMDREPGNGTMPCERDANAKLIAAAPELYDAAKDALESLKRLPDVDGAWRVTNIQQLENALKKAHGGR